MEEELQGNMVLPCQPNRRKGKNNLKQKLLIQDQKGRAQLLMHLDWKVEQIFLVVGAVKF